MPGPCPHCNRPMPDPPRPADHLPLEPKPEDMWKIRPPSERPGIIDTRRDGEPPEARRRCGHCKDGVVVHYGQKFRCRQCGGTGKTQPSLTLWQWFELNPPMAIASQPTSDP